MTKLLVVLLLPAGIAAIVGAGILLSGRWSGSRAPTKRPFSAGPRVRRGRDGGLAGYAGGPTSWDVTQAFLTLAIGVAVLYGVMVLLGLLVEHAGPTIDKPIFHWMAGHTTHIWRSAMKRATEVGDKFPTWAAAVTAAVCLAVTWSRDRWVAPVALVALIPVDHFLTLAINHTITRTPPPGAGGIFPSGGTDRAVAFYGLIAYLLWREFSGRRRTAIIAGAVVAALGFEEGYTRVYLGLHWFTDVVSGFIYGCLLLAVFIAVVRVMAGPARGPAGETVTKRDDELAPPQATGEVQVVRSMRRPLGALSPWPRGRPAP